MSALRIQNLGVRLGRRQILSGIDAEIKPGEFVGIFGPNGAGKSTLVRSILGLCPVSCGTISVMGKDPQKARAGVGYMPQNRSSFEGTSLSARAMVSAVQCGHRWGIPWVSRKDSLEVDRALKAAGAESYADRSFSVLSGGEKQRITLAQALLGSPSLLVLDEPLASLDPKNQGLLVERVGRICKETGTTILFVAHDLNPLLSRMDRVWYLANCGGKIGAVHDVVNSESLSKLYGAPMEVVKYMGRIFILSAEDHITEAAGHA